MRDSSSPELCAGEPHRWCVYLLTLTDCSAFKIGFSCNLLQRLYSFSHRYFEQFDLRESLALRLEGEAQARRIEATLKQEFSSAQLSAPTWVREQAGGHTEWFSAVHFPDAATRLRTFVAADERADLADPRALVGERLRLFSARFEAWAVQQARYIDDVGTTVAGPAAIRSELRSLRDWLDAYRSFGIDLFVDDPAALQFVRCIADRWY